MHALMARVKGGEDSKELSLALGPATYRLLDLSAPSQDVQEPVLFVSGSI